MSESNKHIDLFTTSGCLTSDALKMYSTDQLTNLQKEEVDNHLESCELCSDALEGIQLLSDPQKLDKIVSEINENLKSNLAHKQTKKDTFQNRFFYIAAAASIIILIGFYFYLQNSFNPEPGSQSISQVVEMEEKSLPPMPKGKSQESNPPVEPITQSHNEVQTVQQETTNEVIVKTETEKTAGPAKQIHNQAQTIQQETTNEVVVKTEIEKTIEPDVLEQMMDVDADIAYVAPLNTFRASESIPESLAMDEFELDVQEDMEEVEYQTVDIASNQPLEYYIGGVVVYDNTIDVSDQAINSVESDEITGNAVHFNKTSVAPQMVASESKKGKRDKRQENILPVEKGESSLDVNEQNENHFFSLGNEVPQFPGGYESLIRFLNTNLNYPKEAREQRLQGQLVISFVVEENGEISSAIIVHGIGGGCDEEAIRVIESMPAWEPAIKDEKPVRVLFNMPITFRLN